MVDTDIIGALLERRAVLNSEIASAERQLEQLYSDCSAVDQVLRLYGGGQPATVAARRKIRARTQWFLRGETPRLVLDGLRRHGRPMTSMELTLALMRTKGYDTGDEDAVHAVQKTLHRSLAEQHRRGTIRQAGTRGTFMLWEIVP